MKTPNLKTEIVSQIEKIVGKITSEEIFDYIYALLHSPSYREKYKEFLKIDFPRVPYPKDKNSFNKLVKFGTKLRQLHLLEVPEANQFITTYPVEGSNTVEKISYGNGQVFINKISILAKCREPLGIFILAATSRHKSGLKTAKAGN